MSNEASDETLDGEDAAVAELLNAIAGACDAAALAYTFSSGNGYTHAAVVATHKVARLAGVTRRSNPQQEPKRRR
jgi:hypothetical protein